MTKSTDYKNVLLSCEGLSKHYVYKPTLLAAKKAVHAVQDVSLEIFNGDTLGLIGGSGSGKSTLARLLLRLIEPSSGSVDFMGQRITEVSRERMRRIRKDLQIVFQTGSTILDPRQTIQELLREPLSLHKIVEENRKDHEINRLLELVGLSRLEKMKTAEKMSGGQVQRVLIARAIAVRPSLIVCDEPVSALDVSVQGQILNLLSFLKKELNITYLFISHDLKVVRHICNRLAVMNAGHIVETGDTRTIMDSPAHEYTQKLLASLD